MKRKILTTLLAASLAFNVCFAAGYLQAKAHIEMTRTPEGRAELFLRKLDLDEEQMAEVRRLRDAYFAEWRQRMEAKRAEYDRFWTEIVKDDPDEAALETFIQSASGVEIRARFVRYMRDFMKVLRPDQRRQVVDQMRRRSSNSEKQSEEREQRQASGPAASAKTPGATEAERREP